jgi:hypothetical protein
MLIIFNVVATRFLPRLKPGASSLTFDEAAAVRFGDAVERDGGGGPESEVSELHAGTLGPVLVEGGSVWVSGGRVT